jgi:hypothetical protein
MNRRADLPFGNFLTAADNQIIIRLWNKGSISRSLSIFLFTVTPPFEKTRFVSMLRNRHGMYDRPVHRIGF